jgi:hypothetical protein
MLNEIVLRKKSANPDAKRSGKLYGLHKSGLKKQPVEK